MMSQALTYALTRNRLLPIVAAALVVAVAAAPAAQARSTPEIGVRPGQETQIHAEAAADAGGEVHMGLSWRKVQFVEGSPPDFSDVKAKFETFLVENGGPGIASVRVIDAPEWAAGGCEYTANVTSCPPTSDFYPEFREFVTQAVTELGPGTDFNIDRFILWNEPSLDKKWGGEDVDDRSFVDYSNLLNQFRPAVTAATNSAGVSVEAGEVAAGGSKPVTWARKFTQYNSDRGRNDNYDVLTIHAYAETASGVVGKINQHAGLRGVEEVAVSEFGWAVGRPNPNSPGEGDYKCTSLSGQNQKFRDTVTLVKRNTTDVTALVWLNVIDENKGKTKCIDNTGYYAKSKRDGISPYGLFKRAPRGGLGTISERPIVNSFRKAAAEEPLRRANKMVSYEGNSPVLAPLSALPLSGLL